MSNPQTTAMVAHYGTEDLTARVAEALRHAGLGDGVIAPDALAPLDQFHVGGARATAALAALLAITPGERVLDVGCGLGGPSRYLAAEHGCAVEGIDLSPQFAALATMLTARTGLSARVTHRVADAVHLPFEPDTFDFAWTQHVAMNIADRDALYTGICRVLRPRGRLALYDVVAGEAGPPHFPVPWARDPAHSFLLSPDATRDVLERSGFAVLEWIDATAAGLASLEAQSAAARDRPDHLRALALPLVMGPEFPVMAGNLARSLREGRARLLQAVVQRNP